VTKSGTNDFHGNVREYNRTAATAANSFFNNANRIARPALRRHQYGGSIGGPLPFPRFGEMSEDKPMFRSGKDRLFFFFDTENRRDRSQVSASRTVPLQTFRNGQLGYIRATNAQTGATCTTAARANDPATAGCIGYLSLSQTAALDPQHLGVNQALLNLYNSRFPLPNDLTGGDGINTGLFRWNAPNVRDDHIYTTRVDAVPTDNQRLFFRVSVNRRESTNSIQFLPQDEDSVTLKDTSYGWVVGHTWIINPNLTNVAIAGISKSELFFTPPSTYPAFPFIFSGGTLGSPFASPSYQDRLVTTPTLRDDVTWTHGNHTLFAGVQYKPISQKSTLTLDYNFVTLGIGGNLTALSTPLRPADILNSSTARSRYDSAFATLIGRIGAISTNYNYNNSGQVLPLGSGKTRNYAYNEYEAYVQDNWKIRSTLTLNLGVRYNVYPAPYEKNGILAADRTDWRQLLSTRLANAAAGKSGDAAEPFLVYDLAGKTNNAAPLYDTDKNNWAPRLGFAWSPAPNNGLLKSILGERKTSIRGSYGMTYDRVSGAILFIQNQSDYLFQNSAAKNFSSTNAVNSLLADPRFTGVNTVPAVVNTVAPTITRPFTPFVEAGVPFGNAEGQENYTVDPRFKTPYSHLFDFGVQRELPGNHLLDVSYVGRLGRSLFVQSDLAQVTNFKDPASGQFLFNAFNQLQTQLQAGGGITPIAWFENLVGAAALANYGVPCSAFGLGNSCTALVASPSFTGALVQRGDTSDTIQALAQNFLLGNNIGMSGQFSTNAYVTNQGNSDYHGMLVSLRKRYSKGYQYSINYTYSKSLDNNSSVANTVFGGLVCDVTNPDICRGPSDFDIRHILNGDFIAELPLGRGRWLGGNMPRWANAIVGGWTFSGIFGARSGFPFSPAPSGGSFPISFEYSSPAVITNMSAFKMNIHTDANGRIQFFDDPVAANAALRDPHHGETGQRNVLRSPNFWNLDMGLSKKFQAPWSEHQSFSLRVDAFNVTNSNFFSSPNTTRSSSSFGIVTASQSSPRELQFGVRWSF